MHDLSKNPFVLYEKALRPAPWPEMLYHVAQAGYDGVELSVDESDGRLARLEWGDRERAGLTEEARRQGVRLVSMCLSGHRRFPLGSSHPATERRAKEIMQKAIAFCADVGIRILQVAGYDVYYEPQTADTSLRYRENLLCASEMAAQAGVMLAIEPVEKGVKSVEAAMEIVREINSPWLKVYPDIANLAALGYDPPSQLALGGGHIVDMHIRDARRGFFYGVEPGTGIIDFHASFAQLSRMDYHGPLTLEMWNLENPEFATIIRNTREFMLNRIRITNEKLGIC